ncbi:MAG: hypothetical protein K2N48_05070 [Muribaculaceae bacterium]|nr:hypothetical protein [Muribaculaceae bacterium]
MKFVYTIKTTDNNKIILKIASPYIIDEFAKAFMQQFIKNHECISDLPDGNYIVDLYKDITPFPSDPELSNSFYKNKASITFNEAPFGL